jgi:hypothetical protein
MYSWKTRDNLCCDVRVTDNHFMLGFNRILKNMNLNKHLKLEKHDLMFRRRVNGTENILKSLQLKIFLLIYFANLWDCGFPKDH